MTNAEKITKDTDFLVELLVRYNCDEFDCTGTSCPIYKKFGRCFGGIEINSMKQYLESDADEK